MTERIDTKRQKVLIGFFAILVISATGINIELNDIVSVYHVGFILCKVF